MKLAVIFLSAGLSTRMGSPKLTLLFQGKPLIFYTILPFREAKFKHLFAVTGKENYVLENQLKESFVTKIHNKNYLQGMSSSVLCALNELKDFEAFCILPADQPFISAKTLTKLWENFCKKNCEVLIPKFKGKKGHPVFFSKKVHDKIISLQGDFVLKRGLSDFSEETIFCDVEDKFTIFDVDTTSDLEKLKRMI